MPLPAVLEALICHGACKGNVSKIHVAPLVQETHHSRAQLQPITTRPPRVHLAIAGDVLVKVHNLHELNERCAAVKQANALADQDVAEHAADDAAQQRQEYRPFFSQTDSLLQQLLGLYQELVKKKIYNVKKPTAAASALRGMYKRFCEHHKLPFDEKFHEFVLEEFLYPHTIPGKTTRLFKIKVAHTCNGLVALWHVPRELEQAWAEEARQRPLQGTYNEAMLANLDEFSSALFWASVVPHNVKDLLHLLRSIQDHCSHSQQPGTQSQVVLSCNVLGLGERVGFLVLALLLHVDPLGIFLQLSKILLQKPHYPLHMMDGCCLNPRKELVLPRGSMSLLLDTWHIPGFDGHENTPIADRIKRLFADQRDFNALSTFIRVQGAGFSCTPKVDASDDMHISGIIKKLVMLWQNGVFAVGIPQLQSLAHSIALQQASSHQQTYQRVLERADQFRSWWSKLTRQQQHMVITQYRGRIDVQMLATLVLSTPALRSKAYRNAVEQLYAGVLPTPERAAAEEQQSILQGLKQQHEPQPRHGLANSKAAGAGEGAATTAAAGNNAPSSTKAIAATAGRDVMGSMPASNSSTAAEGYPLPKVGTPKRPYSCVPKAAGSDAPADEVSYAAAAAQLDKGDDPSPSYDQPKRRQRTELLTEENTSGHHTSSSATAAATEPEPEPAAMGDINAPDVADAAPRIPAHHFMLGGSKAISNLLSKHKKQPTEASTVISIGSDCRTVIEEMLQDGHILLKFSKTKEVKNQQVGDEDVEPGKLYTWGALVVVGYGDERPGQQQLQQAEHLKEAGQLISSHYCRSQQQDFEAAYNEPFLLVKSMMKTGEIRTAGLNVPTCYPYRTGGGSLDLKICAFNAKQLFECRRAVFYMTVVLLLLWHGQDKLAQMHPALKALAEKLKLQPVAPVDAAKETSTAQNRNLVEGKLRNLL